MVFRRPNRWPAPPRLRSWDPLYDIRNYSDLWLIFFYRFVQPAARMGPALNYAARIRDASADLLPGGWVLLRSPERGDGDPGGTGSGSTR